MPLHVEQLDPSNIEVLGHKVTETDAAWTGLDWSRPVSFEPDRIRLPWCHPDDQTGSPDDFDSVYSVYPPGIGKRWRGKRVKDAWFLWTDGKYYVAIRTT